MLFGAAGEQVDGVVDGDAERDREDHRGARLERPAEHAQKAVAEHKGQKVQQDDEEPDARRAEDGADDDHDDGKGEEDADAEGF